MPTVDRKPRRDRFAELAQKMREQVGTVTVRRDRFESTLGTRINQVESTLGARIDRVEATLTTRIDHVESTLTTQIDQLTTRTDRVDARLDRLEARFDALIAEMREGFEQTRRHFDVIAESLISKIQLIAEGVVAVNQRLDRFQDEVRGEFRRMDARILRLEARVFGSEPPRS